MSAVQFDPTTGERLKSEAAPESAPETKPDPPAEKQPAAPESAPETHAAHNKRK